MRVVIPDDYQDAGRGLDCFSKLAGHDVTIFNDTVKEIDELAERFRDAEALVLIRERTRIGEPLLARLPNLKLISQTGKGTSLDNALCTPHLGYVEEDSYELYFSQAFDQVVAFAAGLLHSRSRSWRRRWSS